MSISVCTRAKWPRGGVGVAGLTCLHGPGAGSRGDRDILPTSLVCRQAVCLHPPPLSNIYLGLVLMGRKGGGTAIEHLNQFKCGVKD